MYLNVEVETFEENGKKFVYLANDGSSGCKYKYKTKDKLKQIVADYIADLVGYYAED